MFMMTNQPTAFLKKGTINMKKIFKKIIASTIISAISILSLSSGANALGSNSKKEKSGSYWVYGSINCAQLSLKVNGKITNSNVYGNDSGVVNKGFNVTIPYSYRYYDPAYPQKLYYSGSGVVDYGEASKTDKPKTGYYFAGADASYVFDLPTRISFNLEA